MMIHCCILMLLFSAVMSQTVVKNLPGFAGKLPFKLETGYIGVGENEVAQLFYYFIESESNPKEDPLVLWLTGGPGCSSLSGLVYEIGPFSIDYDNSDGSIPALRLREHSWTKVANVLFLDQPAGTGFSYAKSPEAYYTSDTSSTVLVYEFIRKWLINHPNYLKHPFYISGDSYSGITIPLIVDNVFKGIELGKEPHINFKGYTLGNPVTDGEKDVNERMEYAFRMGLLSDGLYQSMKRVCHGNYVKVDLDNAQCQDVLAKANKCLDKIRRNHILERYCGSFWRKRENFVLGRTFSYGDIPASLLLSTVASKRPWCRDDNYVYLPIWVNDKSVQKALHIREGTITEWKRCNETIGGARDHPEWTDKPYVENVQNTTGYHVNFTRKHCRALIYSGDHDMTIPHIATKKWIDNIELPIQRDWTPWFVEGQVAGYTMTYGNGAYELTFATVKGSGHTAPEYNPKECLAMLRAWLSQSDL